MPPSFLAQLAPIFQQSVACCGKASFCDLTNDIGERNATPTSLKRVECDLGLMD